MIFDDSIVLQIPQQSSVQVLGSTPPKATVCTKVGIWSVDLSNGETQGHGHIQNGSSVDL